MGDKMEKERLELGEEAYGRIINNLPQINYETFGAGFSQLSPEFERLGKYLNNILDLQEENKRRSERPTWSFESVLAVEKLRRILKSGERK
jgi:hypothetical protein